MVLYLKNLIVLVVLIVCYYSCATAQTNKISNSNADSIGKLLKEHSLEDTVRFNLLIKYSDALQYSDTSKSIQIGKQALALAKQLNYRPGIVTAYRQLGALYLPRLDYHTSLQYAQLAIKEALEINDTIGAQIIENNIAQIYANMGDFQQAIKGFKVFYRAALISANEKSIAMAVNNIALCYLNLGNLDSAEYYLTKVVFYGLKLNEPVLLAYGYANLGAVKDSKTRYKDAITCFEKALAIAESNGIPEIILQVTTGLSEANYYQKNYAAAEKYALQGIEMSRKAGVVQQQYEGYKLLTDIYQSQNKYKEAFNAYQQYVILSDSMRVEGKKQIAIEREEQAFKQKTIKDAAEAKLREAGIRYRFQLIIMAIVVIAAIIVFYINKQKRDAKQRERETALTLQISETELKALRAQMNPHFLNNAFISIQEFVSENRQVEAEKYLVKFSKLMRAVLECADKKEIPLSQDLEVLEWYLQFENLRMEFPFTYNFQIDEKIDPENTFIPPLILQPLVENAIKHGLMPKRAAGHISIIIEQKGDIIRAIVEDDGVGRNPDKKVEEPVFKGRQSMGMKITRDRINIINTLKNIKAGLNIIDLINDNKPVGTRIELFLPYQS